jgi:hypothetical protein
MPHGGTTGLEPGNTFPQAGARKRRRKGENTINRTEIISIRQEPTEQEALMKRVMVAIAKQAMSMFGKGEESETAPEPPAPIGPEQPPSESPRINRRRLQRSR